jgi:CO/xanthine dehydrogenase FAD-binding subunit
MNNGAAHVTDERVLIQTPSSIDEAVSLVADGWIPLAGGTDIVPRLTWNLLQPARLVNIGSLPGISGIRKHGDTITIGAMTPLHDIENHPLTPPWLREAIEQTASRVIRNRATLTGNILQGRRCRYYNRPFHWRSVAGRCRRMGGSDCFTGYAGPGCVAALKSVIAAVLVASRSTIEIRTSRGDESIDLYSLYSRTPLVDDLRPEGLVTAIHIPVGDATRTLRSAIMARRSSLDFPEIAIAVNRSIADHGTTETIMVMTAPLPKPSMLVSTKSSVNINDDVAVWIGSVIPDATTGHFGPGYLRNAAEVLVQRTLKGLRA